MHISCTKLLISMKKKEMETVGGESGMKCPNCNSEMEIDKECGYMKQYRCDVCRRIETVWTVCVTA